MKVKVNEKMIKNKIKLEIQTEKKIQFRRNLNNYEYGKRGKL